MTVHDDVYSVLELHQRSQSPDAWSEQTLVEQLHRWRAIFDVEFKLELPHVAFSVKSTRRNCYGYFRPGHNEFGVAREIAIDSRYLAEQAFWQTLGTLLHELLHAWQHVHGVPGRGNYHNMELQAKAKGFGLIMDRRGYTSYAPKSPFFDVLAKHGLVVPNIDPAPVAAESLATSSSTSKLRRWQCACGFGVRVAVLHFNARCIDCGQRFVRSDSSRLQWPTRNGPSKSLIAPLLQAVNRQRTVS